MCTYQGDILCGFMVYVEEKVRKFAFKGIKDVEKIYF
jgi:hypothetical protein